MAPLSPNVVPLDRDIQERDRREVEQLIERGVDNLTAPALSTTDDNEYSVEYPRHGGHHSPLPFDPYTSFARSQHFDFAPADDRQEYNRYQPPARQTQKAYLSYREDDTYRTAGDTMSTANHHRSGITLGAGIRGRIPSLSPRQRGGEYDPDRQIDRLIDQRGQMSMFDDATPRKTFASHPTFDPIIVDDTAEIDRAVESGHLQLNNVPVLPQSRYQRNHPQDEDALSHPESDISSFRRSDPPTPPARPKLSDAFERVADDPRDGPFSPKKQVFTSSPVQSPRQRLAAAATTKRTQRQHASPPVHSQPSVQAQEQVSDRSKSEGSSKFTKLARGLKPEIDKGRRDEMAPEKSQSNIFVNAALDELASRLQQVEHENSTARRRVHELELELDQCKEEAKFERTRLEEERRRHVHIQSPPRDRKGKGRANDGQDSESGESNWEARYQEVCQEKKSLEGLVSTLQTRVSGLTNDVESYRSTIVELREELERDVASIQAKTEEVETLRDEIERLEEEVARLRSVVEESLRTRRTSREAGMGELSAVTEEDDEHIEEEQGGAHDVPQMHSHDRHGVYPPPTQDGAYDTETELDDNEDPYYQHNREGRQPLAAVQEATIEYTQQHSIDPVPTLPRKTSQQVLQHQIQRTRSGSNVGVIRSSSRMSSRAPTPRLGPAPAPALHRPQSRLGGLRADAQAPQDDDVSSTSSLGRPLSRASRNFASREAFNERNESYPRNSDGQDADVSSVNSDPGTVDHTHQTPNDHANLRRAKTTRHHSSPPSAMAAAGSSDEMPFPRLRGERAEKLFFAATMHDERKCRKCRRRRKGKGRSKEEPYEEEDTGEWLAAFLAQKRERAPGQASMPSQSMLAHLARELEDEFTHHKSIYVELAEQYAIMDAVSNVAKRNILAEHLRDVIDTLELKGDQIAALYDLLSGGNRQLSGTPPAPNMD
ncbi:hypothetical protein FRB97_004284 [Tulasnella sp. 331]|nr:hypothetical protein FRB97_004284 [Tulasnella sp. 331]